MKSKSKGIKHLVECHCVLPQYRDAKVPIYHKFTVFSVLDESDTVIPKFAECNNCGVAHKVYDILKSEIVMGRDEVTSCMSIDDIKLMMSSDVANVLDAYHADIATWEHALFIQQNSVWGSIIILSKEEIQGEIQGKALVFVDRGQIRIEPFTRQFMVGKRNA